jgi:hypothetical protein
MPIPTRADGDVIPASDINGLQAQISLIDRSVVAFTLQGVSYAGAKQAQTLMSVARAISRVKVYSDTAPAGADLIVDVNKNGATVFSTQANRPKVVAGANAGLSVAPDVTALAVGDRLSIDVDQVGSSTPGGDNLMVNVEFV